MAEQGGDRKAQAAMRRKRQKRREAEEANRQFTEKVFAKLETSASAAAATPAESRSKEQNDALAMHRMMNGKEKTQALLDRAASPNHRRRKAVGTILGN